MADVPTDHPESLAAGDTLKFERFLADYSSDDGWSLTYFVRGRDTGMALSYTGTPYQGGWRFAVGKDVTVGWTTGQYRYEAYVYKAGERHKVDFGRFEITPDFQLGVGGLDIRTTNEKILDAIIATIQGTASSAEQQMSIGNKSISRFSPMELEDLRARYEYYVRRERAADQRKKGKRSGRTINVRLGGY